MQPVYADLPVSIDLFEGAAMDHSLFQRKLNLERARIVTHGRTVTLPDG